jgi:diguanylate cyclase (GGDEF)-like protein
MATRLDKVLGILYFDLNGFKFVNDNFGHSVGDQVLIEIAKRMKNRLRNGDTVARVGGYEFVVLTNMLQEPVQAYSVAKKVNQIICEPIQIDGNEFNITVSIGISTFPEVTDVDKLVQCADMAMYEAKASKQHFACFYTKHLENKYQKQKLMEDALDSAINNKELSATFQPILSRNDDQGLAVEALCRWRSGSLGTVATEQFIPIAESSKLGDRLGSFMLEQCAQLKKVCDARGIKLNKICINIFARQFTDKQFARRLLKEADELGLAHHHLCVEITERQMIENIEVCQVQLATLKLHGVQVALDDFGTGFSSITHLKNLPIDFLKLDRSLIAHVDTTEDNQAICDGIIHMAHRLKIKVTAEGIERIEEYQTLAEMGCDEFQGHLLGYPMAEMDLLNHWHKSQLKMLPGHKGEDHNESRPTH